MPRAVGQSTLTENAPYLNCSIMPVCNITKIRLPGHPCQNTVNQSIRMQNIIVGQQLNHTNGVNPIIPQTVWTPSYHRQCEPHRATDTVWTSSYHRHSMNSIVIRKTFNLSLMNTSKPQRSESNKHSCPSYRALSRLLVCGTEEANT